MACFSLPIGRLDGQHTYQQHSSRNRFHNPHAKHYLNKFPPQSDATQKHPNSLETRVASPTQPSPATGPQSTTGSSKHRHSTQRSNSSHHPSSYSNMNGQHRLHNSPLLSKPSYKPSYTKWLFCTVQYIGKWPLGKGHREMGVGRTFMAWGLSALKC